MIARVGLAAGYVALMAAAYVAGLYLYVLFGGIDWSDLGLGPKACRSDNLVLDSAIESGRILFFMAIPMAVPTALALWRARQTGRRSFAGLPFAALALVTLSIFAVDLARDLEFVRMCEAGLFSTMAGEAEGGKPLFVEWPELPLWMDQIEAIPGYMMLSIVLAVLFVTYRLFLPPLSSRPSKPD